MATGDAKGLGGLMPQQAIGSNIGNVFGLVLEDNGSTHPFSGGVIELTPVVRYGRNRPGFP